MSNPPEPIPLELFPKEKFPLDYDALNTLKNAKMLPAKSNDVFSVVEDLEDKKPKAYAKLEYRWEDCVYAYWDRFKSLPNPNFPVIEACEEKRYEAEYGRVVYIIRKVTLDLSKELPGWVQKVIGKPKTVFYEYSITHFDKRIMILSSQNHSLRKKVKLTETCIYCAHPDDPNWTYKELKPNLKFEISFLGIEKALESALEGVFVSKTSEAVKLENKIIAERLAVTQHDAEQEVETLDLD